jgi:VCBS repeat-containing protein
LANDQDVDGDTLSVELVDSTSNGQLTLAADGSFTYTPNANYHGPDSFTYRINDGQGLSNTATVDFVVRSINDTPVADNDNYNVDEDDVLVVPAGEGVLVGDADADDDSLSALLVDLPEHGSVQLAADGSFTYTPDENFHGQDRFTYRADDGQDQSNLAEVTIDVASVNDPTVAHDDLFTLNEDETLNRDAVDGVLANDFEVDGDPLEVILVDGPTHGQLTLRSDGSLTYVPEANFHGDDSFTYKVDDGTADSNTATVVLRVTSVNDPPVADGESYATDEDTTLVVGASEGVLVGDTDVEGSDLTATLVDPPEHGNVQLAADGSFTYTPNDNFHGQDGFTYRADDGQDESNLAEVTIDVAPVDDPTVAADDLFTLNEDQTLDRDAVDGVLANDFEVDGDPLEVILVDGPTHGQLTLNSDGSFSYVPETNFHGDDSFTYKVNDGVSDSNLATAELRVTSVNDPPVADDESYTVDEDTTLNVDASEGVLVGDTDVEGSDLTATLVDPPQNGSVQLAADGSFTYMPHDNFAGSDHFTYRAHDGQDASNLAQVTIAVNPIDDPPVAVTDLFTVNEDEVLNPAAVDGVLANDIEVDGDPLTATLVEGPTSGQVTFNSDGSFVYVPNENFNGGDQFSYRISDGITDSNVVQALIIVEPVNDAPVATPDEYSVDEDTSLIVDAADGLLANDSDIDSGSLGATLVDGPAHGQVEVGNDGSFRYVPDADFNGTDTFTYRADDAIDASATVEVTMTVNPVDDPPRIDPVADQTTFTGSEFNLNITASDPDNSGAGIEFSLADDAPSDATIDPISGLLAWTPAEEDAGEVTFSIRATNTQTGLSSSITVNVQVFSSSALQALEEANARRRASRRSIPSERRALRSRAVLRRISRGPASLLSLGSVGRPSGIATGQIGVNTGVANITTSSDAEQMEDDAKKDAEKKDDSKRERKRRRPEDNSETNEQSSDAQRRAHDEAVNQLRIDKSSIPADSLQDLASNKIEERLRDWSEAGALQPAPIDVAADVVTSNLARGVTPPRAMPAVTPLPRELVVVMANDDAPTQAEEITETSDDLPVETVVAVAAAGTLALPLLVTGLKRYTRSPTQRALSALVHRLRD